MWSLIVVLIAATPLVLHLIGRRNERAAARDWEMILTPRGQLELNTLRDRVKAELALAEITYVRADAARERHSLNDAVHLLDQGCRLIEQFCPTLLTSLAAMGVLSRMISAMTPVKPLKPSAFRVRQLASMAYLNQLVHYFLTTTAERFRLRVQILGRCASLATRLAFHSAARIKTSPNPLETPEWGELKNVRHDIDVVTDESLESFRLLLMSMAAERR